MAHWYSASDNEEGMLNTDTNFTRYPASTRLFGDRYSNVFDSDTVKELIQLLNYKVQIDIRYVIMLLWAFSSFAIDELSTGIRNNF